MPIHEYCCADCGQVNEFIVGIGRNSDPLVCKDCGSSRLEAMMSLPAAPIINEKFVPTSRSTCCGSLPSEKGCVPGSCCGS